MDPALSKKFPPELQPGSSLRFQATQREQTETTKLANTVESVVLRAMDEADSSLRLGENACLAVISERDLANFVLHPEEVRILAPRARPRKRVEFALGRAAAHYALKQLGIETRDPVLRGPGGEPLWGDGIAGSITHCRPWGVAVVVKGSNRFAVGVDLETVEGIQETDISHLVCHSSELDWVRQGLFQERMAMIFSAKEAVYKAFYPLCRRYIDFKEVRLTWLRERNCFQGEFVAPFSPNVLPRETCAVHCWRQDEFFLSCVIQQLEGGLSHE